MKKIIELEGKWRTYKYRKWIYYVFIFVLIIFFVLLAFFIRSQFIAKKHISALNTAKSLAKDSIKKDLISTTSNNLANNAKSSNLATINFVCKKVIVNKLTVRSRPSFESKALGYYSLDSIFCAESNNVNGLIKTPNGWVSANDKYSTKVNPNMFADFGFTKYKSTKAIASVAKTPVAKEVKVLQKEETIAEPILPHPNITKPAINITSEVITQDRDIELKKIDFDRTNSYDTAIKIAEYYFNIKDYPNAIKWSLNASKAESNGKQKSQSWIIYSKSLYLSGNKDKAIEVLDKYASTVNTEDVNDILNDMKRGII